MFWSAASMVFALTGGQLQKKEAAVWDTAKNSVVVLLRQGLPTGQAALIDRRGLFLASQGAMTSDAVDGRLANGRLIRLQWKATDTPTQTVLLQAEEWKEGDGVSVSLHDPGRPLEKAPVIVVLPGGPVRGELVATNRLGVVNPSKRTFPLGEVHFEATEQSVAGGLVFDDTGHLVGILNATLSTPSTSGLTIQRVAAPQSRALQKALGAPQTSFGPGTLTVAYTVGPDVLRRVVTGFLSPSHKVQHPAIGVYCRDATGAGALIQQVRPESPALAAGLEAGDVIVKMDDTVIRNQFDFARFIEAKEVGDPLTVVVVRNGVAKTIKLTVGAMPFKQ